MSTKLTDDQVVGEQRRYLTEFPNNLPARDNTGLTQNFVTIGHDVETGEIIRLGNKERCGGVYVLGKPRTGKSNLLINLARQDIENGHGLLFIDPHADAIADIIARLPGHRKDDVILLDPTDETYAFGNNPLACSNPKSLKERNITFGQAMDIFTKLFADPETGELGILLSKYLRNSFYPLIENQGYTLLDIELFLTDKQFREHLLKNVSFNPQVIHFWQNEFGRLPKKDQVAEIQSTLNRLNPFLTREYIRDIIGQGKNAIDFGKCMDTKKIVLLRMPIWLDDEVKTFIGIIIISQLLKAAWLRSDITKQERIFFALYCDEFQNFATPDFAKLFTQTGKFNIMPAVAHQVREGQLKQGDPNRGATDAAAIKIFFQLAVKDSKEQALTFTKKPPQEAFAISRTPFDDLLKGGHTNPIIQSFTDRYLWPLQDSLEDIKEGMEGGKLLRDYYRDVAGLARVDERRAVLSYDSKRYPSQYAAQSAALASAESALVQALGQGTGLLRLDESSKELRLSKRGLDRFLTAIMEGQIRQGQEAFSAFIMYLVRVRAFSLVPEQKREVLDLYIALKYGDRKKPPAIRFTLAQAHGLLQPDVTKIQQEVEEKVSKEKVEFVMKEREKYEEECRKWLADKKEEKRKRTEAVLQEDLPKLLEQRIRELDGRGARYFLERNTHAMLRRYVLLLAYPEVEEVLKPYYTTRLAPHWRKKFPTFSEAMPYISNSLEQERRENVKTQAFARKRESWISGWFLEPESETHYKLSLLNGFQNFIERQWDGWLVVYLLLKTTTEWASGYRDSELKVDMRYPGYNMLYLPAVENREPIEIALTLERLSELVDPYNNNNLFKKEVDYTKYYWRDDGKKDFKIAPVNRVIEYFGGMIHELLERMAWEPMRDDLQLLRKEIEKDGRQQILHALARSAYSFYPQHDKLVINYLQCRACDIVKYGVEIADLTFPQPTLPGVTTERIVDAVIWMVRLLHELTDPDGEKEYMKRLAHYEYRLRKDSDEKFSKQIIPMPDIRRNELAYNEIEDLKAACLRELSQEGWNPQATLDVIDEFVEFCILLPKPENLLKTRTGQLVTHRSIPDMEAEASLELVNLDPYTAEAKLIRDGKQGEVKIKTEELPDPRWQGKELENLISQIKENMKSMGYVRKRSDIEREITQRQEEWRSLISNSTRQIPPSEEPPPTSYN